MKILEFNEKEQKMQIIAEVIDDFWYLDNCIDMGDIVYGTSYRRTEENTDLLRSKKAERVRIWVGIAVESTEFQEFSDRFRIHGKIVEGAEEYIGEYQTLNIELGSELIIKKHKWSQIQLEELKKAEQNSKRPVLLFLAIDTDESTIAIMREYGLQELARINIEKPGKDYDVRDTKQDHYSEILSKLNQYYIDEIPLLIIGPGFAKEHFYEYLKSKNFNMKNVIVSSTSYGGMHGIYESLKSGALDNVLSQYRTKIDSDLVEMLLREIHKEGLYAYGIAETKKYAELGAVRILLVTDLLLKDPQIIEVMNSVKNANGTVHIISTHHEPGKILKSLGNIAAMLRFK
jgi:protein pelota